MAHRSLKIQYDSSPPDSPYHIALHTPPPVLCPRRPPTKRGCGEDPEATRHPAGLKYMVTELVCRNTGGPEVVTSLGFDEATATPFVWEGAGRIGLWTLPPPLAPLFVTYTPPPCNPPGT